MKNIAKLAVFSTVSSFLISQNLACVTTRAQLNEMGGVTRGSSSPIEESNIQTGVETEESTSSQQVPQSTVPVQSSGGDYNDPEFLRSELARLIGRVDELEQKAAKGNEAAGQVEVLQKKIEDLESKLKVSEAKQAEPEDVKLDTFKAAKEAYAAEKFVEANEVFQRFIQKGNGEPKQIEEATYLSGECFFKQKEFKKAIVEYSKFTDKFQKSMYHPKALLRIAESFDALDLKDDAKAFYAELADKFPRTAEGKLAKKRATGGSTGNNKKKK